MTVSQFGTNANRLPDFVRPFVFLSRRVITQNFRGPSPDHTKFFLCIQETCAGSGKAIARSALQKNITIFLQKMLFLLPNIQALMFDLRSSPPAPLLLRLPSIEQTILLVHWSTCRGCWTVGSDQYFSQNAAQLPHILSAHFVRV